MHALALMLLVGPGCDRSEESQPKPTAEPSVSATKSEADDDKAGDSKAGDDKTGDDKAKVETNKAPEVPETPESSKTPDADAPPQGWTRVDLSTLQPTLAGTVDLPPGRTAEVKPRTDNDADGMNTEAWTIQIGPRISGLELETSARAYPHASMKALVESDDRFEIISTHEFSPDHWAVVRAWREGECMLRGWSKAAGLTCDVFKASCKDIEQWVEICGTVRPGPAPNTAPTTPKSAFPQLDEAAATVAITGARAVVRSDPALLRTVLGPDGVKIGKKAYTAESFEAALATKKSMLELVAPDFHRWLQDDDPDGIYSWNSGPADGDEAKIWFSSGYGDQAYFVLRKIDGSWRLTRFDVEDLGEP